MKWSRRVLGYIGMGKFIGCSMCVGFWVGGIISYVRYGWGIEVLLYSGVVSIVSFTWYLIFKDLMDKHG